METLLNLALVLGFVCNFVAIWVVLRQGVKQIDLKLALVMALCDMIVVVYKLTVIAYVRFSGDSWPLVDVSFGQWHGAMTTFLLQVSASCVGHLALLRFWAIFLRRRVVVWKWWCLFLVPQAILLWFIVVTGIKGYYVAIQNNFFFFPNVITHDLTVRTSRHLVTISYVFALVAVNVSYPCIARRYGNYLKYLQLEGSLYKHTFLVYAKIIGLILMYNLTMLPAAFVLLMEMITNNLQSYAFESFAVLVLVTMTIVNPLILLIIHHRSLCEFKALCCQIKSWLKIPTDDITTQL